MATKKTARKNKKPSKKFLSKVHDLTEKDIFKSIAIASILFNILFMAALVVLSRTDSFDRGLYQGVKSRYCKNLSAVEERANKLGDEKSAIVEWHVTCQSEQFAPYFEEAVTKFKASTDHTHRHDERDHEH